MSDGHNASADDVQVMPATPEDVAILYSWANLPGAKYRDFSASRREYRAQQRARLAEEQHQAELQSAQALEEAARRELEEAQRALDAAQQAEAEAAADAEAKAPRRRAFRQAEATCTRGTGRGATTPAVGRNAPSPRPVRAQRDDGGPQARRRAGRTLRRVRRTVSVAGGCRARRAPAGQLDDPYYYTGQVDPAYFAATPGVRTSQASRASTERKSYVFPVHPGSDEFDAGTLQSYRSNTPFAPSPAQDYSTLAPMRDLPPMRNLPPMRDLPRNSAPLASGRSAATRSSAIGRTSRSGSLAVIPTTCPTPTRTTPTTPITKPIHRRSADGPVSWLQHRGARPPHPSSAPFRPRGRQSAPPPSAPSQPVSWAVAPAQAAARSHRDAAVDNRARTVRQPRPEESFPASSLQVPADNNPAVPPAWLAYQEEASTDETAAFDPPRPPVTPQPQRQAQPWQPAEPRPAVRHANIPVSLVCAQRLPVS